jgi:hypothetical protein
MRLIFPYGARKCLAGLSVSLLLAAPVAARAIVELPLAGDSIEAAEFGRSIAMDEDRIVVGAPEGSDAAAVGPGAAYVFRRIGRAYVREAKLVAPDPELGAEFGRAVAVRGDVIVVGARFASNATTGRAGAAYIYTKKKGVWSFQQKVTASDSAAEDNFGRAVALDKDLLVVTARKEDVSVTNDGSAYVFHKHGGTWVEAAKLTASDSTDEARFGQSVAARGNLIVVGARDANTPIANGAGAIYVFSRIRGHWVEAAKIGASDGASGDQFAYNLAIEGNLIAVGARRADLPGARDAGAIYLYKLRHGELFEVEKLAAPDAGQGDELGHSVAMSGDFIVAGARRADVDGRRDQGAVYVFRRSGHEWATVGKVVASDGEAGAEFGHSLAAHDGMIAVGANLADIEEVDQGGAYVYRLAPWPRRMHR